MQFLVGQLLLHLQFLSKAGCRGRLVEEKEEQRRPSL